MTTADYLTQLQQDREDLVDNLETMGITGLTGDETFTELVPEVLNIEGGADLSEYFDDTLIQGNSSSPSWTKLIKQIPNNLTVGSNNLNYCFKGYNGIAIPFINTTSVTGMSNFCRECINLVTFPQLNTSSATEMNSMFYYCTALENVPILDTQNVTDMNSMFSSCPNLTDTSLDNILQMCINATRYPNKTLYALGFRSTTYSVSRIEALPHYQDFIDAGWSIGF